MNRSDILDDAWFRHRMQGNMLALDSLLVGVSEAESHWRPESGAWSIVDTKTGNCRSPSSDSGSSGERPWTRQIMARLHALGASLGEGRPDYAGPW